MPKGRFMPVLRIALDFDLVRQIVLRLEEVWESDQNSSPTDYMFDGFRVEVISHNIQKLYDAGVVFTKALESWESRDQIRSWPTGFTHDGWKFLAAAKEGEVWDEAVKTVEAQGEIANLKALKRALV